MAAQMHDLELKVARPSRVSTRHLKLGKTHLLNRGAWSVNTADLHWLNFNLA